MALKPYVPFDWPNLGEPLVPFIAIKFRGVNEFFLTFPDKTNRIYLESASFNVLDDSGYSTASITLADPDFYNLETIFVKALFLANTMTKGQGNWYCAAYWGWSYYGKETGNPPGQRKISGLHYYMLRDLNYNLTDVDLRVTIELMDIGASALTPGEEAIKVGLLKAGSGVTHGTSGTSGATSGQGESTGTDPIRDILVPQLNASRSAGAPAAVGSTGKDLYLTTDEQATSKPAAEGQSAPEQFQNIVTGKSYWQIIQIICQAHQVNAIARLATTSDSHGIAGTTELEPTDGPAPGEESGSVMSPEYGRCIISQDDILNDKVKELLLKISNVPANAEEGKPTWRWGILAGGKLSPKKDIGTPSGISDIDLAFGWIPQPPKGRQKLEDAYRLARVFTYRPGQKMEIARGETMINSLNYEWTSKGYWGVGATPVYAITPNEKGAHTMYVSDDDYRNPDPKLKEIIAKNPTIKQIPLQEVAAQKRVEIKFNFDTRTGDDARIKIAADAIIINVWNYFIRELININIEIPGDPWLDNHLFSSDGKEDGLNDILVDLYHAYFKVKVYKLNPGTFRGESIFLSEILSGNYLCLKGCSHKINDGDYTTSMQLMKAF